MQTEDLYHLSEQYTEKGTIALHDHNFSEALQMIQDAAHLYHELGEHTKYARSINLLGVIYATMGNESMAVDSYLDGLTYSEEHELNSIKHLFYNNIGSRYQELHQHQKAISYFKKASIELTRPECKAEESHSLWQLINYLNLSDSYSQLGEYKCAKDCLVKALPLLNGKAEKMYRFSYTILLTRLQWFTDEKQAARSHCSEILSLAASVDSVSNYVQIFRECVTLLKSMEEYTILSNIIAIFEHYILSKNNLYFHLNALEMKMSYYYDTEQFESYKEACIQYAELYQAQKAFTNKDRALVLDIKMTLKETEQERKKAEEKSERDALTVLHNRYRLERFGGKIISSAILSESPVALGIIDVDHFKGINDSFGHLTGDSCLRQIADIISDSVDGYGTAYRLGGDEFVLIIKDGTAETIHRIAQNIQTKLYDFQMLTSLSTSDRAITLSQGYTCLVPQKGMHLKDLLDIADQALYTVKHNNRNNYLIFPE